MFYPLLPLISTSKSGHVFDQYTLPVAAVSNITGTYHESEENGAKQLHFHHNLSQFYTDFCHWCDKKLLARKPIDKFTTTLCCHLTLQSWADLTLSSIWQCNLALERFS